MALATIIIFQQITNTLTEKSELKNNTVYALNFDAKDFFKTDTNDISFTDYEGALTELNTDGYDSSLTSSTNLKEFILRIVNYALGFLGLLAVIIVIYGGVLYVSSAGNDDQIGTAKNAIKYAVIGLIIVLGSFAFVNTIIAGAGGGAVGGTGQGTTTAGRVGGNFNSSAEEIKSIAYDIYTGYANLATTTEEFKNIQNDASKTSLNPGILPSKSDVLNYLSSVRSKLSSLESKIPKFSKSYVSIKNIERELDRQIDEVKTFNIKRSVKVSGGKISYCNPDDPSWGDILSGTDPCASLPTYYEGLYEFWGETKFKAGDLIEEGDLNTEKTIRDLWVDGDLLSPVIANMQIEYQAYLDEAFYRLSTLKGEVETYDSLAKGMQDFERMQKAYGFKTAELKINTDSTDEYNIVEYMGDNFYKKISEWQLGAEVDYNPMTDASYYLDLALAAQSDFYDELSNLEFVAARLTANTVEGNAPLTVIFDALATNDPAGGSLDKNNIIWDLGGKKTISELMIEASNSGQNSFDYINNIIGSENVSCDITSNLSASELAQIEEKVGATSLRCIYNTPGTYNAAIKIKSNDAAKYAPGISVLKIKVNPPTTKINLAMSSSGLDPTTLMKYEEDVLKINKKTATVTLGQAQSGINFDASDTYAELYKWDFGNGETTEYSGSPSSTAYYDQTGKYEVKLEVQSKLGVIDRKIFTLEVANVAAKISDSHADIGLINMPITLDGSQSKSDKGQITSYEWTIVPSEGQQIIPDDLKNDSGLNGKNLSVINYEFKYPLKYDITLTVRDQEGTQSSDTIEGFTVKSKPPVAQFDSEVPQINIPSEVHFNGDLSFDPDGSKDYLKYTWNISADEGTYSFLEGTNINSKKPIVLFDKKGEYEVSLEVEDVLTSTSKREYDKVIKNIEIDKTIDLKWSDQEGFTKLLEDDGTATVEFNFESKNAVAYEIDFGDGIVETGEVSGTKKIEHKYTKTGRFDARLTVFNQDDEDNTIKRKVFIGDGENPIAKVNLYLNNSQIFDFSDPIEVTKKDVLRFDASDSKNIDGTARKLLYSWDLGDTGKSSEKEIIHTYRELSPTDPGYYTVKLKVFNREDTSQSGDDEIKIVVKNMAPKFTSIQGTPNLTNSDFTTPITVSMKAYGAEDLDGKITQYRWWYYDLDNPDDPLGLQLTTTDTAQLIIGTNGKEGEEVEYGLALMVIDNDNLSYSSEDIYTEDSIPTIKVVNGPNELPKANFNVSTTNVFVGDAITFTSSSEDSDGSIVRYIWDFEGDGFHNNEPTDQKNIEYKYSKMNLDGYKVKLKVIDDKGGEAISKEIKIYVDVVANPPKAAFKTENTDVNDERVIKFTNNSTSDTEAKAIIISNVWDFDIEDDSDGDGNKANDIDSRDENPSHLYPSHGIYKAKLMVTDNQGNKADVVNEIVVGNVTELNGTVTDSQTQYNAAGSEVEITYGPLGQIEGLDLGLDTGSNTNQDLTPTPPATTSTVLNPILKTIPQKSADGIIYLTGDLSPVKFDFSQSEGDVKYFIFDKNINLDSDGNGIKDDDIDFVADKIGTWQTNFERSYGETEVKFTMINNSNLKKEIKQKIVFS